MMVKPWRVLARLANDTLVAWAQASNDTAVAQAREAAVACSRASVERAGVTSYLAGDDDRPPYVAAR